MLQSVHEIRGRVHIQRASLLRFALAAIHIRERLRMDHDLRLERLKECFDARPIEEVARQVRAARRSGGRMTGEARHLTGWRQMAAERLPEQAG